MVHGSGSGSGSGSDFGLEVDYVYIPQINEENIERATPIIGTILQL